MKPYDVMRVDLRTLVRDWRNGARALESISCWDSAIQLDGCADEVEALLEDHE